MISGFNTDVVHKGTVYHVQTEDKGRGNPVIESLVYVGGQVVVSKRDEYSGLVADGADDQQIAERMDRQHKVLIAAIKSGRFDEQLAALSDSKEVLLEGSQSAIARAVASLGKNDATDSAVERRRNAHELGAQIDENVKLDEIVLHYLDAEAKREHLVLALEEDGEMHVGQKAFLALRASSSRTGEAVDGAAVTVRMISTVREPEVLGEGVTDQDGECFLNVQIPALGGGSAALIISASSDIGDAEIKHLL
jgi:hypothetical protein